MHIHIDNYGAKLSKTENRFRISFDNSTRDVCADDVDQIVIASPALLTSDAVQLAVEKHADIVFVDWRGTPYARITPCHGAGLATTRRLQYSATTSGIGANIAVELIQAKLNNQHALLRSLAKSRNTFELPKREIFQVKLINSLSVDDVRQQILGAEGNAAHHYYAALSQIVPMHARIHKGADAPNALLNYGYGILYSQVEAALSIAGLDPYMGFLHTDRYNKPSLVLDVIEPFRAPIVDRVVATLYGRKQITDEWTMKDLQGIRLSDTGRRQFADAIYQRLHTKYISSGENHDFIWHIQEEARKIVRALQGKQYNAFRYGE